MLFMFHVEVVIWIGLGAFTVTVPIVLPMGFFSLRAGENWSMSVVSRRKASLYVRRHNEAWSGDGLPHSIYSPVDLQV